MRGASCDESTGTGPIIFIALNTDKPPPPKKKKKLNENTHIMMTPTVITYEDNRSLISNKEILPGYYFYDYLTEWSHLYFTCTFLVVFYSCGI